MTAHLRLVEPSNENRSVAGGPPAVRPPNAELRQREYLTPAEIEKLTKEARQGRYGHRDATLILIAFRHGLRASEICDLEWSQVEFGRLASLHVRRVKNGKASVHPLRGDEVRALRELRRQFPDSAFVFATERGGPFTPDAISVIVRSPATSAQRSADERGRSLEKAAQENGRRLPRSLFVGVARQARQQRTLRMTLKQHCAGLLIHDRIPLHLINGSKVAGQQ